MSITKKRKLKNIANLFIVEPFFESMPNGKIGRTIKGETFYGYQQRRRKKAKRLSEPMQKAFRVVEKVEETYHRAMVISILVPTLPIA